MSNRIYLVTSGRDGDGKTTIATNLAVQLAKTRRLPVVLFDMDSLGRGETAHVAGVTQPLSAYSLLDQLANKQLTFPMLKGRVSLNRHNVGTVTVPILKDGVLKADQWAFFLQQFSLLYDIVIDFDLNHPLRATTLDMVDSILWLFRPDVLSVRSMMGSMEMLLQEKFGFHRFVLVENKVSHGNPMALEPVYSALDRFSVEIAEDLPFDPDLERLMNMGRLAIQENDKAPLALKLQEILTKLSTYDRDPNLKLAFGAAQISAKQANSSFNVVDTLAEEKRLKWNASKQRLHRDLVEELNIRRIDLDTKGDPSRERQLRTNVESTVNSLLAKDKDLTMDRDERERLVKELVDEALGLGPLEELLRDPSITEIMVNRADQVYIERKGKIILSGKRFIDNNHVVQVIRRIISPLGRRIDESVPLVDARLRDGSRVNAIIPPLAVQGPTLTVRRFPEKAFNSNDLINLGAINQPMIDLLKVCVLLKKNMVISGGTGTGKTTILNMLSSFIPEDERIVTVEDTAELRLLQDHVVRLEARPANIEGHGQISIRDLVKNCLRMRPDRIVVGECRGGEALDMLQAMNTGHEGSLTTIHANTPRDCFTRLETLCLMAGMDLPVWALRTQIQSAVHIVIQLTRMQDGTRKVTSITEVTGSNEDHIISHDLFRYVQDAVDSEGRVVGHHEPTGEQPLFMKELQSKGLALDPNMFHPRAA